VDSEEEKPDEMSSLFALGIGELSMKLYDRTSSLIFLVLALAVIWRSFLMPIGSLSKPGPGFLPLFVGILLALLSSALWIEAGLRKSSLERVHFLTGEGQWLSALLTVGSLLAYALLLEFLGFIICALLLLFFLFWVVGKQKWWVAFIGTVLVTLFSHLLFKVALDVQLPGGLF
jgi:putative tricarboxylic transport membrane protein